MSKSKLGQFYTKNSDYILSGFENNTEYFKRIKTIIEPFSGEKDLINWIKQAINQECCETECYDIDPKHSDVIKRDTLLNPPDYSDKFIITNPPYLALNKSQKDQKEIYEFYKTDDLYKCFIKSIINNNIAQGGIVIIPLNFWSSIRVSDIELRKEFLKVYNIICMNIFEEQVFEDTSYTVCSFMFCKQVDNKTAFNFNATFFPSKDIVNLCFNQQNNYTFGGEIYNLPKTSSYEISRYTRLTESDEYLTHIIVKCIDDKTPISFIYDENKTYCDETEKLHNRSYLQLVIKPSISKEKQIKVSQLCNNFLNENREKYHSLFLTNFREGKRKRISFELVYNIVRHILD